MGSAARGGWSGWDSERASRRGAVWRLFALVAASWVAAILVNFLASRGPAGAALLELQRRTAGLVEPTLAAGLAALSMSGAVLLAAGRLRPADVGWIGAHAAPARSWTA